MTNQPFETAGAVPLSDDRDDVLTFNEGCAFIKMSPRWTGIRVRDNSIPHIRLGRIIRFRRSALIEWLARQEQGGSGK